ncbi:MAG: WD40 repeat domain-containing protein [Deltaproteobacteria bacterium]|nr:WD40 repeat domain-containing protein [Deltaproteobacteria bacterium]
MRVPAERPDPYRVELIDVSSCSPVRELLSHEWKPELLRASPDGAQLAVLLRESSGESDGLLVIVGIDSGQRRVERQLSLLIPTYPIQSHGKNLSLAWSHDGQLLAVGPEPSEVALWRMPNLATWKTYEHPGRFTTAAFSPDGKLLATAAGSEIRIWQLDLAP